MGTAIKHWTCTRREKYSGDFYEPQAPPDIYDGSGPDPQILEAQIEASSNLPYFPTE